MSREPSHGADSGERRRLILFGLFFLSGATSLVYQILWIRLLSLSLGSTLLAVSWVVGAFMAGLAWGSEFWGRRADRGRSPILLYARIEAGVGVSAILVSLALTAMAGTALPAAAGYALSAVLLFVPTFLMGGTLPVLSRYAEGRSGGQGGLIGALYGVNTVGAIVGVGVTGFVLIHAFGIRHTTWIAVAANFLIAGVGLLLARTESDLPEFKTAGRETGLAGDGPARGNADTGPRAAAGIDAGAAAATDDGAAARAGHGDAHRPKQKRAALVASTAPASAPRRDQEVPAVAATYFVNGLIGIAFEILWTRSVLLIGTSTIYAFTIILTTFLCGIGAGSALMAARVDRLKNPAGVLARLQCLLSLVAGASPLLLRLVAAPAFRVVSDASTTRGLAAQTLSTYVLTGLLILPATLLLGACFPLVARVIANHAEKLGGAVGRVYALNTVGGVAGSVLAGFVALPLLGIERSIGLFALVGVAAGIHLARKSRAGFAFGAVSGAIVLLLLLAAPGQFRKLLETGLKQNLSFYREGTETTVGVYPSTKAQRPVLVINNVALDDRGVVHKLLADLPGAFMKSRDRALVLGFGVGITSQSIAALGFRDNRCVEISPEVMAAAPEFAAINGGISGGADPRFHVILQDGRRYLLASPGPYDLIALDANSGKLRNAGVGKLYTREFFALCRSRLAPGGMVTAYVSPNVTLAEFKMIARTFQSVFPHTTLWIDPAYGETCVLLGSQAPLSVDLSQYASFAAGSDIQSDLAVYGLDQPGGLLLGFVMGEERLRLFARDGEINSDDHPVMEFFSLRSDYFAIDDRLGIESGIPLFRESVRSVIGGGSGDGGRSGGESGGGQEVAGSVAELGAFLDRAESVRPLLDQADVLREMRNMPAARERLYTAMRRAPDWRVIPRHLTEIPPGPEPPRANYQGQLAANHANAGALLDAALDEPDATDPLRLLTFAQEFSAEPTLREKAGLAMGKALEVLDDDAGAYLCYRSVAEMDPADTEAKTRVAPLAAWVALRLDMMQRSGQTPQERSPYLNRALTPAEISLLDCTRADGWLTLAQLELRAGRPVDAYRALRAARSMEPRRADVYVALGQVARGLGGNAVARESFERALALDSSLSQAREALRALPQ